LLSVLGDLDPSGSKFIRFDVTDVQPRLPYHVAFQIHVECMNNTIKYIVIDEGASTSVMSLSCWKSIGSPQLSQPMNMLFVFDGNSFRPHVLLPTLHVKLGCKTMAVEVDVVDAPLDYNILLGYNWTYAMNFIFSFMCYDFLMKGRL
jgi:hypothetical protein